ncbi:HPF/RaiA family ribosome-associated protein [Nitrosomonas ureae]|uniref:Sigma 54 modulation protein / S30EA ribosomal protein n=1 Tax=Nitrosomonas ureae TaxID=44577 RepID=A0A1H9D8B7_9PROT|nr:HPF/RaiA family ribosome-associated protein [Nitrosomonas ureae]PTQ84054.1 sigma 54 modulation/S30EA-like ribosomal protein [Nitrosomonas ureae]PXX11851.1 sigma 54 modulation/S30EA-like ribosomal protein [Nitrosomonas ureae]SEQ09629.1 Sigma 54 modulation protein / S30EA ribosomal protein [Nitrosomonas ureae]
MQIQVNTDHNVEGHEEFSAQVKAKIEDVLNRFNKHVTRVEVHISDENSDKGGMNDKRCLMEARLEGRQPVAVTHQAANLNLAIQGAVDKLKNVIESTLGRLDNH